MTSQGLQIFLQGKVERNRRVTRCYTATRKIRDFTLPENGLVIG